jgi:ubiquitin conjugation factor E4 B
LERSSLLGLFLTVSALPDVFDGSAPPPALAFFESHRRGDAEAATATVRALALQLQQGLHGVAMALLRHKDPAREGVLAFLARMVNANAERGKMQINPEACASHGAQRSACVSLSLCMPAALTRAALARQARS